MLPSQPCLTKQTKIYYFCYSKQELKALLDPEFSIIRTFQNYLDDKKSENSDLCLMALDLLLLVLLLDHVKQFRNFDLVFLSVSQCQGIAPCYATLEWIDFLEITCD